MLNKNMSSYNLYNVMSKEVLLTVRTKPEIREEFKKVAELRGASMSTLIHQYMVGLIREEKEREPNAFKDELGFSGNLTLNSEFAPEVYPQSPKPELPDNLGMIGTQDDSTNADVKNMSKRLGKNKK